MPSLKSALEDIRMRRSSRHAVLRPVQQGGKHTVPAPLAWLGCVFITLFVPFWCQFSVEYCIPRGPIVCLKYFFQRPVLALIGYLCLLLPFVFLLVLTRRPWIPTLVYGMAGTLAAFVNFYKKLYAGNPVLPLDLFWVREATGIASDYNMPFTAQMAVTAAVFVLVLVGSCFFRLPLPELPLRRQPGAGRFGNRTSAMRSWLLRGGLVLAAAAATAGLYGGTVFQYDTMLKLGYMESSQYIDTYHSNSFYTTFFTLAGEQLFHRPPVDYSEKRVDQLAQQLSYQESGTRMPDIIEILWESYNDMEPYRCALDFEDVLSPCAQVMAEGVSGQMITMGYGSSTGNIEYEVLTGFDAGPEMVKTVAFSETFAGFPSLPVFLKQAGYSTAAIHPYTSELYHRQTAYAHMGFDDIRFIDDFVDPELIGGRVSDAEMVREIIRVYEQQAAVNEHVYIHGVSMQNHSPYSGRDLSPVPLDEVTVTGNTVLTDSQLQQIRTAITLNRLTSEAIAQLADYLRGCGRDVLLIMYGDHRTPLADTESNEDCLVSLGYLQQPGAQLQLHLTPYIVWSNFEQRDAASYGTLSPNLLASYALQDYGVIAPSYFTWLYHESRQSPVRGRSGDMVVMADGSMHWQVTPEDLQALSLRHAVQYNAANKHGKLLTLLQNDANAHPEGSIPSGAEINGTKAAGNSE